MKKKEQTIKEKFFKWGVGKIESFFGSVKNNFLILSIKNSNIFLAKMWISFNADINCVDFSGKNLLHIVMSDMKLRKGESLEQLKRKKKRLIAFLVSCGFDTDTPSQIKDKNGEVIEITPLQYACQTHKIDFINTLIELGANVNSKITNSNGCTALMYACKQQLNEVASILLNNFADPDIPDNEGNTPLHEACSKGDLEMMKLLIKRGADINKKNNKGETPLHIACKKKFVLVACFLIQNGANIESVTNDNLRPIHYACMQESVDITQYLIRNGVNINSKTAENDTPLKISIDKGNAILARELLKSGANINEFYNNRWQALHFAVKKNLLSIVNLLYEFGADLKAKTLDGMTPHKLACINKNTAIKDFLIDKIEMTEPNFEKNSHKLGDCKNVVKDIVKIGSIGKQIYDEYYEFKF